MKASLIALVIGISLFQTCKNINTKVSKIILVFLSKVLHGELMVNTMVIKDLIIILHTPAMTKMRIIRRDIIIMSVITSTIIAIPSQKTLIMMMKNYGFKT